MVQIGGLVPAFFFLDRKLYSTSTSTHVHCGPVTYCWGNPAMDWHPIQGGWGWGRELQYCQLLCATETGLSSSCMGLLVCV